MGVSVGAMPRGPSVKLRGSSPCPATEGVLIGSGPARIGAVEGLRT